MNLIFSFVLVLIHGLVGVWCTFDPENVVYQIKKPYKKNTFVCDLRKQNDLEYKMLNPYCFSNTHSFTFTLTVKDKRRSTFGSSSNLKSLISTLRDNALCNLKHMKFDAKTQRFSYFQPGESYIWYEDKTLNSSTVPNVYIDNESTPGKVTIKFNCPIPVSDAELSQSNVKRGFRSSHSHPSSPFSVTVSGFHLSLLFYPINNMNINLNSHDNSSAYYDTLISRMLRKQTLYKIVNRFFVFYDGKCQSCSLDKTNNVNCNLLSDSCESEGKCYKHGEIYNPLNYDQDTEEKPFMNSAVCNIEHSQTSLYMPCRIQNGNCSFNQTCSFNAKTMQVDCV